MMEFEQIAYRTNDILASIGWWRMMGHNDWVMDEVEAIGQVYGWACRNVATLAFNYTAIPGKELELIEYTYGDNWLSHRDVHPARMQLSHMGLHVPSIEQWKKDNAHWARATEVAQEVTTVNHTNPAIKDTRRYKYVVYNTFDYLGFDVKLIERIERGLESDAT